MVGSRPRANNNRTFTVFICRIARTLLRGTRRARSYRQYAISIEPRTQAKASVLKEATPMFTSYFSTAVNGKPSSCSCTIPCPPLNQPFSMHATAHISFHGTDLSQHMLYCTSGSYSHYWYFLLSSKRTEESVEQALLYASLATLEERKEELIAHAIYEPIGAYSEGTLDRIIEIGLLNWKKRCIDTQEIESMSNDYHHGITIKEYRQKRGMSQQALAERWP